MREVTLGFMWLRGIINFIYFSLYLINIILDVYRDFEKLENMFRIFEKLENIFRIFEKLENFVGVLEFGIGEI